MGVLDEKVAIVTGSARGIGRATAELLAGHGARVVVDDLDGDAAARTAEEIGGEAAVHAGDLTKSGAADALVQTAVDARGRVDIIVNSAGYAVAFGYIETRRTAAEDASNTMELDGQEVRLGIPDQLRDIATQLIPLGRPGTPQEAAGAVFFLSSPWSDFVHGQVPRVTGGHLTGMEA